MMIVQNLKYCIPFFGEVCLVWQGEAAAKNGVSYKNTYSWIMTFKNGSIIKATAFLDAYELVTQINNETNGTSGN